MEDKKKVLSIKDIAAISGVSIATVSRILNKKGRYSPETEKKVLAVVNSYGYVPNQTGKSLREARSHTIGLIVPNITNAFFSCLAYEIETYLFEKNYSVFICNSSNTAEKEIDYFRTLAGKCVDGILCISALDRIPEDITARQIPIVCIDSQPKAAVPLPWIGNDGKNASCSATSHLLDKGCRHILFITSYLDSYNRLDRRAGYEQALKEHGFLVDKNYILERSGTEPTPIEVEILISQFLQTRLPLDGIIAASESAALGAMYALQRNGISVPADVRIVCFDNTMYSLLVSPPLSSIERHPQKIARQGSDLLLDLIEGKTAGEMSITIPMELIERESSR